jgi:hypothetical protein
MSRRVFVSLCFATLLVLATRLTLAEDDWKLTGTSTRVKSVAFIDVNVYTIDHYVKELPKKKPSKKDVIELEAAKKLVWTMRRDVAVEKITKALEEAFALNDYKDNAKIKAFLAAFTKELKETTHVTIVYDPAKKETTVTVDGDGKATVAGSEFMRGVWSIWFGKIDQEKLGDELLSKLP